MPVDEQLLPSTILRLQALVDFLGQKQAEASACLDRLSQLQKVPDAQGNLTLPTDQGTGAPISKSRRNAIYDACYPDAASLLQLFQTADPGADQATEGPGPEQPPTTT